MGLRLKAGIDLESLGNRYDTDIIELYRECWEQACEEQLLLRAGSRISLTIAGMLHSNELFSRLIAEQ
jgi:coproporphyrinogen III oxidase-like Fe-S oxidoreductase